MRTVSGTTFDPALLDVFIQRTLPALPGRPLEDVAEGVRLSA